MFLLSALYCGNICAAPEDELEGNTHAPIRLDPAGIPCTFEGIMSVPVIADAILEKLPQKDTLRIREANHFFNRIIVQSPKKITVAMTSCNPEHFIQRSEKFSDMSDDMQTKINCHLKLPGTIKEWTQFFESQKSDINESIQYLNFSMYLDHRDNNLDNLDIEILKRTFPNLQQIEITAGVMSFDTLQDHISKIKELENISKFKWKMK